MSHLIHHGRENLDRSPKNRSPCRLRQLGKTPELKAASLAKFTISPVRSYFLFVTYLATEVDGRVISKITFFLGGGGGIIALNHYSYNFPNSYDIICHDSYLYTISIFSFYGKVQ